MGELETVRQHVVGRVRVAAPLPSLHAQARLCLVPAVAHAGGRGARTGRRCCQSRGARPKRRTGGSGRTRRGCTRDLRNCRSGLLGRLRCTLLLLLLSPGPQGGWLRERADVSAVEAVALAALAQTIPRLHVDRRPVQQSAGLCSELHQALHQLLHRRIVMGVDAEEQRHLAVRHALTGGVAEVALVSRQQRAQPQHRSKGLRLLEQQPPA